MDDIVIVGGGIIGLSTALNISNAHPKLRLIILEKEIFLMEYWPLELAKLKISNLPLQGNVTLITGGLGTIGYTTALKFLKKGLNPHYFHCKIKYYILIFLHKIFLIYYLLWNTEDQELEHIFSV